MKTYSLAFFRTLLLLTLIIWVFFSIIRIFYNLSKIFTEEKSWIGLTYEEKRYKAYGSIELMYQKIDGITKSNDCVLLFSNIDTPYFLLRYLLYPKRIYWITSAQQAELYKTKHCHYELTYENVLDTFDSHIKNSAQKIKIAEFQTENNVRVSSMLFTLK